MVDLHSADDNVMT